MHFNPRSLAGATVKLISNHSYTPIFQSSLPRGSDRSKQFLCGDYRDFNPRSLTGATLRLLLLIVDFCTFQSTLPYGSDKLQQALVEQQAAISIHAPLRERLFVAVLNFKLFDISIHAPLRERPNPVWYSLYKQFQSTLPYGSDFQIMVNQASTPISIHAPLRERPLALGEIERLANISIHAPLRERR